MTDEPEDHTPLYVDPVRLDKVSSQLALELVAGLQDTEQILERYDLTTQQFAKVAATPRFRTLYREAKELWQSDANAQERIRAKALSLVEENLLTLFKISNDIDENTGQRLEATKQLTDIAGAKPQKTGEVAQGSRFSVTINLGDADDPPALAVDAKVIDQESDG